MSVTIVTSSQWYASLEYLYHHARILSSFSFCDLDVTTTSLISEHGEHYTIIISTCFGSLHFKEAANSLTFGGFNANFGFTFIQFFCTNFWFARLSINRTSHSLVSTPLLSVGGHPSFLSNDLLIILNVSYEI